jgi:hypothetical protein
MKQTTKPISIHNHIKGRRRDSRQQESHELLNYCHSRGHEQSALRMHAHFFWFCKDDSKKNIVRDALRRKTKSWGWFKYAAFKLCVRGLKKGKSSSAIACR